MTVEDVERVSQAVAARVLGMTPRHLRRLEDAPRNDDGTYSLPALVAWKLAEVAGEMESVGEDAEAVKSEGLERFRLARAEWAELDLQERAGKLVAVEDVRGQIIRALSEVTQKLEALPGKAAPRLRGLDMADIAVELTTDIRDLLDDLRARFAETTVEKETAA